MSPQVAGGDLPAESRGLSFCICEVAVEVGSRNTYRSRVLLSLSREMAVEGFIWGEGRKKVLKK